MLRTISVTGFRANLKKHLDAVISFRKLLVVSQRRNEKDALIIIPIKKYKALQETAYLLSTAANIKRLTQSLEQIAGGKTIVYNF